jgi:hypothetical protein
VSTVAQRAARKVDQSERAWWLRALLVLQSPRPVFAALRDDSDDAAAGRTEPVTALVILAGIAGVLAGPNAGQLFDEAEMDAVLLPVVVFLSGALYGLVGYWFAGGALHLGTKRLGSRGSYRRSRHLLAFATVPLALSLLAVWPVELAVYGGDVFESGGADEGAGGDVFKALQVTSAAWTVGLLLVGVRAVHGWSWRRALAACAVAVVVAVGSLALVTVLLSGA